MNKLQALEPKKRINSIDILRGMALFGVLIVNLIFQFRISIFEQFVVEPFASPWWIDRVIERLVYYGLESKAVLVFTFLFGVGLAVQYERFQQMDSPLYWLRRRMLVLLIFGLLHLLLIWNGDILAEYALAALLLLPLLAAPSWVLALSSLCLFAVYIVISIVPLPVAVYEKAWIMQHLPIANTVYATGSYGQILQLSLSEIPSLLPLHLYIFPRTLALMLLGAYLWRSGFLQQPAAHRSLLISMARTGLVLGAGLMIATTTEAYDDWDAINPLRTAIQNITVVILTGGYAAAVIALVEFTRAGTWLHIFAPIGRMAFTNYIMQSVIFTYIFYGYGLGQFGQLGITSVFLLGVLVYGLQGGLSAWWLRYFRFGPLEWLWRTLTYGKLQSMKRN
ncbi:MAG: DUF418 domain-containing protein [Nitrosomonas sp.]|nr:DUF418 domain-containing protein [Nitrosomonas sp.]